MDTHDESPLRTAIDLGGGTSAVAKWFGITPGAVSIWLQRGQAPAERCIGLEKLCKRKVTRYALRPDVFGAKPPRSTLGT